MTAFVFNIFQSYLPLLVAVFLLISSIVSLSQGRGQKKHLVFSLVLLVIPLLMLSITTVNSFLTPLTSLLSAVILTPLSALFGLFVDDAFALMALFMIFGAVVGIVLPLMGILSVQSERRKLAQEWASADAGVTEKEKAVATWEQQLFFAGYAVVAISQFISLVVILLPL